MGMIEGPINEVDEVFIFALAGQTATDPSHGSV